MDTSKNEKLLNSEHKGMTGFENTKPLSKDLTDSAPGQNWEDANKPSDDTQPHQSGRNSTAAGGLPGTLGNLPPMQDRPYTPVGQPNGGSRNPHNVKR